MAIYRVIFLLDDDAVYSTVERKTEDNSIFVVIVAILLSAKRTGSIALIVSFMLYILSRAKVLIKKLGQFF